MLNRQMELVSLKCLSGVMGKERNTWEIIYNDSLYLISSNEFTAITLTFSACFLCLCQNWAYVYMQTTANPALGVVMFKSYNTVVRPLGSLGDWWLSYDTSEWELSQYHLSTWCHICWWQKSGLIMDRPASQYQEIPTTSWDLQSGSMYPIGCIRNLTGWKK